jgi:hypothetical protein
MAETFFVELGRFEVSGHAILRKIAEILSLTAVARDGAPPFIAAGLWGRLFSDFSHLEA